MRTLQNQPLGIMPTADVDHGIPPRKSILTNLTINNSHAK